MLKFMFKNFISGLYRRKVSNFTNFYQNDSDFIEIAEVATFTIFVEVSPGFPSSYSTVCY